MIARQQEGGFTTSAADDDVVAQTAAALVCARAVNRVLTTWPARMPRDLDEGYTIQDRAITVQGETIGGWKVGRIQADLVEAHGTDRLAGPILRNRIAMADDAEPDMPVLDGFAAGEGEILIRLAHIPDRFATLADIADCVAEVRIGIEIASSPFVGINQHGPAVTVADFGNNYGLVLGPEIPNWRAIDLMSIPVQTHIDDRLVGKATLSQMLDGPFGAVRFLIDNLRCRGRTLSLDDWVSTGAITGVHDIRAGQRVHVAFGTLAQVACGTTLFGGAA